MNFDFLLLLVLVWIFTGKQDQECNYYKYWWSQPLLILIQGCFDLEVWCSFRKSWDEIKIEDVKRFILMELWFVLAQLCCLRFRRDKARFWRVDCLWMLMTMVVIFVAGHDWSARLPLNYCSKLRSWCIDALATTDTLQVCLWCIVNWLACLHDDCWYGLLAFMSLDILFWLQASCSRLVVCCHLKLGMHLSVFVP